MDFALVSGELLFSQKKSKLPIILLYSLIVVLIALIIFYFLIGSAVIDGMSMKETLQDGQRVVLLRNGYTLEREDIVTFTVKTDDGEKVLIKRVIALGGDRVLFVRSSKGHYVDLYICKSGSDHFQLKQEDYIVGPMQYNTLYFPTNMTNILPYISQDVIEKIDVSAAGSDEISETVIEHSFTVSANCFYFMGDNRNHSTDSRFYGEVKTSEITGKVIKIIDPGSALDKFMSFLFPLDNKLSKDA